jgi:hypothetical protein
MDCNRRKASRILKLNFKNNHLKFSIHLLFRENLLRECIPSISYDDHSGLQLEEITQNRKLISTILQPPTMAEKPGRFRLQDKMQDIQPV